MTTTIVNTINHSMQRKALFASSNSHLGRRSWAGIALLMPLMLCSGCEFGRQWFQMSSDSPMPFFGFDLLPHRSPSRPIAAGSADEISIQTADDRDGGRTAFEPRIIPTPTRTGANSPLMSEEPVAPPRQVIELPELRKTHTLGEDASTENDFGEPFPEPIKLSAGAR